MKKLLLSIFVFSFIFSLQAQEVNAFQKKKLYHSLSIGGQNYFQVNTREVIILGRVPPSSMN